MISGVGGRVERRMRAHAGSAGGQNAAAPSTASGMVVVTWSLGLAMAMMLLVVQVARADDYGMPTEVVEEWGCHDTELRLTCGRLDATIAILEATYTPNCTGQPDDDECIHMDFKKLTRSYAASPRLDAHLTETEAGRQFLEALQLHRQKEEERERIEAEQRTRNSDAHPGELISLKSKRNLLRDTLERLIADYLRELSPDSSASDLETDPRRWRRSARQSEDYGEESASSSGVDESDEPDNASVDVNELRKIEIGSRNITVLPTVKYGPERIGQPSECPSFRRRVTKLDQYELDKALMKDSESRELNIRRVLNYRCSGKNHCSFAFSADYPFSILWDEGIVRIKYICMNDFRLNKFCDERLHIDNEPEPTLLPSPAARPAARLGEPVAEARIQSDQSFHHLKILKSGDDNADTIGEPIAMPADGKRRRKPQRVYSQDFKFFKIIPSNVEEQNESASNEIYLKVDPQLATDSPTVFTTDAALTDNISEYNSTTTTTTISQPTETKKHVIETAIPETTPAPTTTTTTATTSKTTYTPATTTKDTYKPSVTTVSESDSILDNEIEDNRLESSKSANSANKHDNYIVLPTKATVTTKTSASTSSTTSTTEAYPYELYEDTDEDDHSYEDYAVESHGGTVVRKNKVRVHTSHQLPAYASWPLRQGFLATTGYPKFYIGESNCSWTLIAPRGHRVRLTVLDVNLRVDAQCRDVLEIIDQQNVIFSSCEELAKPMQIVSDSNEIQVSVRTTSRLAYAKRGVLIHYTAMGCLLLPEPANGRLVLAARDTAKYACQPRFVFADSAASSRELHCTEHYTWDKSLPDCIEQHRLQPNAITDLDRTDVRHNHSLHPHRRPQPSATDASPTKMADKTTDMLYDVAIPSILIASLFVLNAIIFLVIMRYRNKRKNEDEFNTHEMSRL